MTTPLTPRPLIIAEQHAGGELISAIVRWLADVATPAELWLSETSEPLEGALERIGPVVALVSFRRDLHAQYLAGNGERSSGSGVQPGFEAFAETSRLRYEQVFAELERLGVPTVVASYEELVSCPEELLRDLVAPALGADAAGHPLLESPKPTHHVFSTTLEQCRSGRPDGGDSDLDPEHQWLLERLGWMPGHWYSPYPDLDELAGRYPEIAGASPHELPGIPASLSDQIAHLDALCATTSPTLAELSFPTDNDAYRAGDALVLLRTFQQRPPRRVIEVGSGYSTMLMHAIRREAVVAPFEHIVIDPYPDRIFDLLGQESRTGLELIESPIQAVDPSLADTLAGDDVLFIDSSHVSKPGSDLNSLVFDWLPRLRPGVRVHLHDIHFPFEYRWDWIQQGRAWNEAYLIRAFLQFNHDFSVRLFTDQLTKQRPELMERLGGEFEASGSSLWIERIQPGATNRSL